MAVLVAFGVVVGAALGLAVVETGVVGVAPWVDVVGLEPAEGCVAAVCFTTTSGLYMELLGCIVDGGAQRLARERVEVALELDPATATNPD